MKNIINPKPKNITILDEEFKQLEATASYKENELTKILNENQKELLYELLKIKNQIIEASCEYNYTEGFKRGSSTILEIIEKF